MPQLVNAATSLPEDVPSADAHDAFLSGQYNLPAGELVSLKDPNGQPVSVDASEVFRAITDGGYSFPSDAELTDAALQSKYGEGLGNMAKAFGAGAARTATFGASDQVLTKSGLSTPEALRERAERNPISNLAGETAGVVAPMLVGDEAGLAGVAAAPVKGVAAAGHAVEGAAAEALGAGAAQGVAKKILATGVAKGLGSAVEGAAFGLGQVVSEDALSDHQLTGEQALATVGMSALLAGGLGTALGMGGETFLAGKAKLFPKGTAEQALREGILADAAAEAGTAAAGETGEAAAADAASTVPPGDAGAARPQSLEDIQARVKGANLPTEAVEMPSKQALVEAEKLLPDSQYPTHAIQFQSLDDPHTRHVYKTFIETGSDEARAMQNYEALQKREGVEKLKEAISSVAPGETVTHDPTKAGERLVRAFTDQYESEKRELAPLFKQFDGLGVKVLEDSRELLAHLEEAIPGIGKYVETDGVNPVRLSKYKSTMPFSREVHGAVRDLIEAVNEPELTLGGLRNVRESMRARINWSSGGAARDSSQISSLRKSLMDYMEGEVQKAVPDAAVRDTFRRYAVNEENRSIIERLLGGSISDRAGFAKAIRPEDVLDRLFSNTVNVKAAKALLGKEYDAALANYLRVQAERVTDAAKNGFSSNRFATLLRTHQPELEAAFAEKPETLARIRAWTDKMRILPDAPPANPPNTAKTLGLLAQLHKLGTILRPLEALKHAAGEAAERAATRTEQAHQREVVQNILRGKSASEAERDAQARMARISTIAKLEQFAQKAGKKIETGAKAFFRIAPTAASAAAAKAVAEKEKPTTKDKPKAMERFKKYQGIMAEMQTDPDHALERLTASTQPLYGAAPKVTGQLQQSTILALSFLASKLPQEPSRRPLSKPWLPTATEVSRFNRYFETVESPLEVLDHMREGRLSKESVEAVSSVYPRLYDQMKSQLLDELSARKEVPYRQRLQLALFLGQDLDSSTDPGTILSIQGTYAAAPQSAEAKARTAGSAKHLSGGKDLLTPMQASASRRA